MPRRVLHVVRIHRPVQFELALAVGVPARVVKRDAPLPQLRGRVRRQGAGERGRGEEADTGEEEPAPTEQVAEPPADTAVGSDPEPAVTPGEAERPASDPARDVILAIDVAPVCLITICNSRRSMSSTASTPSCPNAPSPQMYGRPMPIDDAPSAIAL